MNIKEFLSNCTPEEIQERLVILDHGFKELHSHGMFVVANIEEMQIINNQMTLSSFKGKIDYLNSGFNENGDKVDLLELCAIGVCAFNRFNTFYSNYSFITYLQQNLPLFKANIPEDMYEYYEQVLMNGNIGYLTDYLTNKSSQESNKSNSRRYTKCTAIGKAYRDEEKAFVNILVLPTILCILYVLFMFIYTYVLK